MYNDEIIREMLDSYKAGTVDKTISPNDIFYNEHYFEVGRSGVEVITAAVMASSIRSPIRNVLVLPSGHGRVLRHIVHLFPKARIDACDLDPDAVDFCASTFGVNPVYSQEDLTKVHFNTTYDLIWVGSLFTHTSLEITKLWLAHLARNLSDQGIIVATVHGRWCEEVHKFYSYIAEESWQKILEGYHSTGYGFHDYARSENHSYISGSYGISLAKPHITIKNIEEIPDVRIYMYMERGWCDHQDVVAFGRPSYEQGYGPAEENKRLIPTNNEPLIDYTHKKVANHFKNLLKILLDDASLIAMPQWIGLATTTFCNLKCPHCQTHGTEEIRERYNKQRWPYELVLKVADETLPSASHFCLTLNGEPLATPYIGELLNHVRQYEAKLHLTTNGTLLSKEILIQLLPLVSSIDISIDGASKNVVETIRSGIDFRHLLNRIRVLTRACELIKNHIPVPIRFVYTVMGSNIREMPEVISLAHELGVQEVEFYPLQVFFPHIADESLDLHADLYNEYYSLTKERSQNLGVSARLFPPITVSPEKVSLMKKRTMLVDIPDNYYATLPTVASYLDSALIEKEAAEIAANVLSVYPQQNPPLSTNHEVANLIATYENDLRALAQKQNAEIRWCGELFTKLFFNPNGEVSPCCYPGRPSFGNMHQQTVEEIWNGLERTSFIKAFQSQSPPACCVNCPNNKIVLRRKIIDQLIPNTGAITNKAPILSTSAYWLQKAEMKIAAGDTKGIWTFLRNMTFFEFGEVLLQVPSQYPMLRAYLPKMATEEVQKSWTGSCGKVLLAQSAAFMESIEFFVTSLTNINWNFANVLDFGCGWGRLLRLMYKLVDPERVYGVDPWDKSIEICCENKLLGNLALSDYLPSTLPFEGVQFDLIYSFSVFTHLSEKATHVALGALRKRINPKGLLVITVRPEEYWQSLPMSGHNAPTSELIAAHVDKGFSFWPHNREAIDGDITFGETSISENYIRRQFKEWEIAGSTVNQIDPLQVIYFLKPV